MLKYLTAGWFVTNGTSFGSDPSTYSGPCLFVLNRPGFLTGGLGSKGRVVDFSTNRGNAMWPRAQWITVPVFDLVLPGKPYVFARVQYIEGVGVPTPCIGFKTRPDANFPDPEPIGGMPYTSGICTGSARAPETTVIELASDATFQFQWNYEFNGNPPTGIPDSAAISITL